MCTCVNCLVHNICNFIFILVFHAVLQKLSTNVRVSASEQSMVRMELFMKMIDGNNHRYHNYL